MDDLFVFPILEVMDLAAKRVWKLILTKIDDVQFTVMKG
jgi:hypothetical protein